MELKHYLVLVKRSLALVIALALLAGAAGFLMSDFKPVSYEASVSFAVNRVNVKQTEDYQYDGYYAIQASDLVSQTVVSWFATPSVVLEIYEKAGVEPEYRSLDQFATFFKTRKYSSQNIGVKFRERDEEKATTIAKATLEVISGKVSELNKDAEAESLFEAVGSSPVIIKSEERLVLTTLVSLLAGFILGLFLVYVIHYFRGNNSKEKKPEETSL